MSDHNTLLELQKRAFDFFMKHTQLDSSKKGFGLVLDHQKKPGVATIAGTGFMLSALIIGVTYNYISRNEALYIAKQTAHTLRVHAAHHEGFFAHFLDFDHATRYQKSEFSTIDTALCLNGLISVDAFFKDEQLNQDTLFILNRIAWDKWTHLYQGRMCLYMSYNPDATGAYALGNPGYIHQWDMFAEQLMMYVIIGGLEKYQHLAKPLYEGFDKKYTEYKGFKYIYTPGNTLFVYHFPLAWLDLEHITDDLGISWFHNAEQASLAHRACSIDFMNQFKTFSPYFFGFNASDTPNGYRVFHALPNAGQKIQTDGTISPMSMIGSLMFMPDVVHQSIDQMLQIDHLFGPYGFYDGFNFEEDTPWVSQKVYSINKGLELLMINAYISKDVYHAYMSHDVIVKGMEALNWKKTSPILNKP